MSVLEIIAENHLGRVALQSHPKLRKSFVQIERDVRSPEVMKMERERIASIVELCFEYRRETDLDEKENILRVLEEISANKPLELPKESVEEWDERLKKTDQSYAQAHAKGQREIGSFLKKYFSLRAKAGLATQSEVAKKSGLSRAYVAVIESGEHFPQQKTLQKLAKALSVDVSELL